MTAQRLLVKEPFGSYERGDRITKPSEMAKATATHPDHVLREDVPSAKAEPKSKPKAKAVRKPKVTKNVAINDNTPTGESA